LEGDEWNGEDFNIWEQSIVMKHMGLNTNQFSTYSIQADAKNNSHRALHLGSATLGLEKVMSV
jgi:hypothetical protein